MVNLGNRLSSNRKGRITCRRITSPRYLPGYEGFPYKVTYVNRRSPIKETHLLTGNPNLEGGDPVGNSTDGLGQNTLRNCDVIQMKQNVCSVRSLCFWAVQEGYKARITLYDVRLEEGNENNTYDGMAIIGNKQTFVDGLKNVVTTSPTAITAFLNSADNGLIDFIPYVDDDAPGGTTLTRVYTGVEAVFYFTDGSNCGPGDDPGFKMKVAFE